MAITENYKKFYKGEKLTLRELRALEVIDRIRYVLRNDKSRTGWTPKQVHERMVEVGIIDPFITVQNVEDSMKSFYG